MVENLPVQNSLKSLNPYVFKTTAAEAPWSNELIERHNLVLADMLNKDLDDTQYHPDLAVSCCINAKNSLHNVHGFSPYQLAISKNTKLPFVLNEKVPALTRQPISKIVMNNLDVIHKAREAFISRENSEKIRRALSHNIKSSGDVKYVTGDSVYYKRIDSKEWHGPAKVLGQDGQQVLVKNGSNYIRVHPCCLQLINENPDIPKTPTTEAQENEQKHYRQLPNNKQSHPVLDTSDSKDEEQENNHNNLNVETSNHKTSKKTLQKQTRHIQNIKDLHNLTTKTSKTN